jgi:hypothetical protein
MLDKVRKLLAKAEDPACTPAEAEALTAKAAQLIAKYGIDQALLTARRPDVQAEVGNRRVVLDAPYAREKASLLHVVARATGCRSVGLGTDTVHLFGFEADLDCATLLFASLLIQAARAVAVTPVPPDEHLAAWRRTWYAGFTHAVAARFTEAADRATQEARDLSGPGVELVLANRSTTVDRAVTDHYPSLIRGRRRRLSGGGYTSGRQAGSEADLGGPRITGTTTPRAPWATRRDSLPHGQ